MAYKSTLVKKQMSTPMMIKPTRAVKPAQITKSPTVSLSNFSRRTSELQLSNRSAASSKSFFTGRMEPRDLEISLTFKSPEWTGKTLSEKNQWVTRFLNKTKADISCVLKHVSTIIMDGDSAMKDEACELLSMPGINPRVSATDNCLRAIRSKLLEDKCVKLTSELESRDTIIKDLSEQLNKDKHSQETQTCGTSIDELEKSLLDTSSKNEVLRSELSSSNELIETLRCDLRGKIDELISTSTKNSFLNSKIENLDKTMEEIKALNSKLNTRVVSLQAEKNKFKEDIFEAQKQRDDYYESWMEVKEKYEKKSEQLQKLQMESDANAIKIQDEIYKSLMESDRIDRTQSLENKLGEKEEEMAELRSVIGQLEKTIENYEEVDHEQWKTIDNLRANLKQMESRAQCWINRNVRDTFQSRINHLEQLVEKLKQDKKLLIEEYGKTTAENSEQAVKSDKYIKRLQSHMDVQQNLINLMRNIKFDQSKLEQPSTMENIFLKFEDEQKMRRDLEILIQDNDRLQKRNVEYKKVLDSHPFKQLFVTY